MNNAWLSKIVCITKNFVLIVNQLSVNYVIISYGYPGMATFYPRICKIGSSGPFAIRILVTFSL